MIAASFIFFLLLFLGVGLGAHLHSRHSHRDYLLAGQETAPWLVGLSAGATCNSGYMFTAFIGFAYLVGLPAIWLSMGWLLGDYLASCFVHRHLRMATSAGRAETYAGILSHWNHTNFRMFRHIAGFLSLIFMSTYAAAQFIAGGKALHVLFGWEQYVGALIGATLVISYCWSGGLRASIWTDAMQAIVMLIAMIMLLFVAVDALGGVAASLSLLDAVSDTHMDWFPADGALGFWGVLLFCGGWVLGGICVTGQPHIMVRFMALDRPENTNAARAWYYGWSTTFNLLATGVGLLTRVLLPPDVAFDAELALPTIALDLLPSVLVGIVLAGVFAATISTADSLVLSSAANLTDDLVPEDRLPLFVVKGGTIIITLVALGIALSGSKSVFTLVMLAWSTMGAVFSPLIIVYALGGRPNQALAVTMLVSGVACVLVWQAIPELSAYYKGTLGFFMGFVVFFVGRVLGMTIAKDAEPSHPELHPDLHVGGNVR